MVSLTQLHSSLAAWGGGCSYTVLHCFFHLSVWSVPVPSSAIVLISVFSNYFLSVSASVVSGKSLSLFCITHIGSVMIPKSDIIYSLKTPLLALLKPCKAASKFPSICFSKLFQHSHQNLLLEVLVLEFKKREAVDRLYVVCIFFCVMVRLWFAS